MLILKGSQQTADAICDLLRDRKHRMRTRPGVCPSGQTPGYHLRSLQDQSQTSANCCEATFQLVGSCGVDIPSANHRNGQFEFFQPIDVLAVARYCGAATTYSLLSPKSREPRNTPNTRKDDITGGGFVSVCSVCSESALRSS